MSDIPCKDEMWFQHDSCRAHITLKVKQTLSEQFGERIIGQRGTVKWPARSPDLTAADFFLWGHLKNKVYASNIATIDDLKCGIRLEVENINNDYELLERVNVGILNRAERCIANEGKYSDM